MQNYDIKKLFKVDFQGFQWNCIATFLYWDTSEFFGHRPLIGRVSLIRRGFDEICKVLIIYPCNLNRLAEKTATSNQMLIYKVKLIFKVIKLFLHRRDTKFYLKSQS